MNFWFFFIETNKKLNQFYDFDSGFLIILVMRIQIEVSFVKTMTRLNTTSHTF